MLFAARNGGSIACHRQVSSWDRAIRALRFDRQAKVASVLCDRQVGGHLRPK